jgi:hypothetical protein
MIEDSKLYVGGNKIKFWIGSKIEKIGTSLMNNSKPKVVTNPTSMLINPFTLMIKFTVDGIDKYQLILQGDYKKHYKDSEDHIPDITEEELFIIISSNINNWFKRD